MNERIRQKLAARQQERAARLVDEFAAYGEPHLWLAYHAAFPLALTPDLVYQIWVNFDVDVNGRYLHIPWIAVADLLLSGLCHDVGYELYEMENETRQELLRRLDAHPRFQAPAAGMPSPRRRELAYFLLAYTEHHLRGDDPDDVAGQHLAKAQRWTALAHLHPRQAARELAQAFAQEAPAGNQAEVMRLATLTDNFAAELRQFQDLLSYASSMAAFAQGDVAAAAAQMGGQGHPEVAGVPLYVPAAVQRGVDEATLAEPVVNQVEMDPNETFFHTWRLRNSGSRTWGEGYRVVLYRGEELGPITAVPLPPAAPGETVEVELKLSAPETSGAYGTVWRARNPEGVLFGPELRLTVQVNPPEVVKMTVDEIDDGTKASGTKTDPTERMQEPQHEAAGAATAVPRMEIIDYENFDLRVGAEGDGRPFVEVVNSPRGSVRRIHQDFPLADPMFTSLNKYLEALGGEGEDTVELGLQMRQLLFPGEIWSKFLECRTAVNQADKGLRIRLRIDQPELSKLPWEYCYDESFGFLAHSRQTPLVRYLAGSAATPAPAVTYPIRILVAMAGPADLAPLDLGAEREKMERALRPLIAQNLVQVEYIEHATTRKLQDALRGGGFHVLHYFGHGVISENGENALSLEQEDGSTQLLNGERVWALLDGSNIRLMLLNTIESAGDREEPIISVARTLLRGGIPAVMTIPFQVPDEMALVVFSSLYEPLIQGTPLDLAMTEMRRAAYFSLSPRARNYWGVPILHLAPAADKAERLYRALLTLDFRTQVEAFREAAARHPGGSVTLIHGPPGHGQRWLLHRLRARELGEEPVRTIHLSGLSNVGERAPEQILSYIGREIGLEGYGEMTIEEIAKYFVDRMAGNTAVIVLDEFEQIRPYLQSESVERLWHSLARFIPNDGVDGRFFLFLLAHDWISPPETSLPLTILPPLEPISLEALYQWWGRAREEIRPLLPPQEREIPEDEWLESLWKSSDAGQAEELFRQLCRRAGLDWHQIVSRWLDDLRPPTLE